MLSLWPRTWKRMPGGSPSAAERVDRAGRCRARTAAQVAPLTSALHVDHALHGGVVDERLVGAGRRVAMLPR